MILHGGRVTWEKIIPMVLGSTYKVALEVVSVVICMLAGAEVEVVGIRIFRV